MSNEMRPPEKRYNALSSVCAQVQVVFFDVIETDVQTNSVRLLRLVVSTIETGIAKSGKFVVSAAECAVHSLQTTEEIS